MNSKQQYCHDKIKAKVKSSPKPIIDAMFEVFNKYSSYQDRVEAIKKEINEERNFKPELRIWWVKAESAFRMNVLKEFLEFLNTDELDSLVKDVSEFESN